MKFIKFLCKWLFGGFIEEKDPRTGLIESWAGRGHEVVHHLEYKYLSLFNNILALNCASQ